jgi:endoglucanase
LADTGYQFLNWTGDGVTDANTSTSTVTMDQDRNLTANFGILQKVLSLNAGPGGTVTGANTYDYGSEANISAAANTSYQFLNWTGDGVTGANASTTTVTMDQDRNLTANFSLLQPILTLTSESGGSVSGGGTYSYGEMVTIVATPDSGFRFLDWNGSRVANSSSATTTITLTADSNLTATFEAIPASLAGMVDPHEMVRRMGRGINLGNVLSAPEEGRWAPAATERYFMDLADANFTNVRIPMDFYGDRTSGDTSSYSTLANTSTDFNGSMDDFVVSSAYLDRIEEVVTWSLNQGLITVLDFHGSDLKTEFLHTFNLTNSHYLDPTSARRSADMTKFQSIWRAIATRFRDYAPELIFEIVNEPYFELSAAEMDTLNSEIIPIIRATGGNNAYRNLILVGGGENSYLAPQQINPTILSGDSNLIATFHYYDPFKFTSSQRDQYDNNTWGTAEEILSVQTHFDSVKTWSDAQGVPIYLGEFGADNAKGFDYGSGTLRKISSNASGFADGGPDLASRTLYHQQVAEEAIARGFAFSAWDSGPTSNKTIHKRTDSNESSNFDFNSFAVTSYEPPSVTASLTPDTSTWVSEIKDAIMQSGNWPECYGPEGLIKNPTFGCSPFDEGWSLKLVSTSSAQFTNAGSAYARTGNSAAKVTVQTDLGHNKVMLENRVYPGDLNGKRVTVEAWVRSEQAAEFRLQLKVIPQDGVDYGNKFPTSDVYSSETTYQRYLFRHTIGGAIDSIQFKILIGSAPATFYLDDFSITIEEL